MIVLGGALALRKLPVSQYPSVAPPALTISVNYPGAAAQVVEDSAVSLIEQEMNGIENLLYMESASEIGVGIGHAHLRARHRPRLRVGGGAEPHQAGGGAPAGRRAARRRDRGEDGAQLRDVRLPHLAGQEPHATWTSAATPPPTCSTRSGACPASARRSSSAPNTRCACGSSPRSCRATGSRPRTWCAPCARRTRSSPPGSSGSCRPPRASSSTPSS